MMAKRKKLGQMLMDAGFINETQLMQGLERQKNWGGRLGSNLVMIGAIKEKELLRFLSAQCGVPEIDLTEREISESVLKLIPRKVVEQFNLVPVAEQGKELTIALIDPTDINAIDQVAFITGRKIKPMVASYSAMLQTINSLYLRKEVFQDRHQEIIMDMGDPASAKGFVGDDMRKHGGVAAAKDPDLILFGTQSAASVPEPPEPEPLDALSFSSFPSAGQADEQPLPEEDLDLELDPALKNLLSDSMPESPVPALDSTESVILPPNAPPSLAPPPAAPRQPSGINMDQFSQAQKLQGLYHVMLRKGLVSEDEIGRELMRLWSNGKLLS